jgi:hypothetical protein
MSGGATTYAGLADKVDATPLLVKAFSAPDKSLVMPPNDGKLGEAAVVDLGSAKAMKIVLQPGATWELCGKPMLPAEKQVILAHPRLAAAPFASPTQLQPKDSLALSLDCLQPHSRST